MGPDPLHVDLGDGAGAAFLTRVGGRSAHPYRTLNLGLHVGDDVDAVVRNRQAAAEAVGVEPGRVTWAQQVHGAGVATVGPADAGRGSLDQDDAMPDVDALVTTAVGLPLAVLVADCMPVLLACDGAVAAVHAGRRGLLAGVLPAAVARMRAALGTAGAQVRAVIGPHIGSCCYEVGPDVLDTATAVLPAVIATTREGRPALDLAAGALAQLAAEEVRAEVVGGCTACDPQRYFSYRRDGTTGRMAGFVWRR